MLLRLLLLRLGCLGLVVVVGGSVRARLSLNLGMRRACRVGGGSHGLLLLMVLLLVVLLLLLLLVLLLMLLLLLVIVLRLLVVLLLGSLHRGRVWCVVALLVVVGHCIVCAIDAKAAG